MSISTLYILFHGRFPSEKAAALFAELSAKSFAAHRRVVLLVPRRLKRDAPKAFPAGITVVYLPTLDLFGVPILARIAFPVSFVAFSLSCFVYLFIKLAPEDAVDTNESLPAFLVSYLTHNIIFEVHDFPERFQTFYALLFKRVRYVLSTNRWKKEELIRRFTLPEENIVLERNGVDLEQFALRDQASVRRRLLIPEEGRVVVYTGHLYGWKGVETLAEAALLMPDVSFYLVGGAAESVARFTERYGAPNIHAVGQKPHEEMPLWQSAADVLVLPNSGEEALSSKYTSPMKLFEYMATGRPIVASRVPSITEVLNDENAYLVEPDNSHALATTLTQALASKDGNARGERARRDVAQFSWEERAKRIMAALAHAPREPERVRTGIIAGVYALLLGIVFYPFLFKGAIFIGSDATTYYYAAFDFYHQALSKGQSFLWNPLLFSGFPMYLSQVAGYFDPLNYLIFHTLGGFDGVNLRLYIDYLLLLMASYSAGRVFGMSRVAAFCIGPAYMLAFNETFVSNPLFSNSAFLMPTLVWFFGKIRHAQKWHVGLSIFAGVLVGWGFLCGYAQIVIMYLCLFGLLGLFYGIFCAERRLRFFIRFSAFCAMMLPIAALVGAPQIVPALSFAPLTRRGGGVDYALATLKGVAPGDFILFLFPDYSYFPYLSVGRKCLFVGALWFFLAWGTLRGVPRSFKAAMREERIPFIFALVFISALATALIHSPIFYILQHLPVFKLFRFSDRWMYGGVFFLAMGGGFGLDLLSRTKEGMRWWYAVLSAPIALLLLVIVFFNVLTEKLTNSVADICMKLFSRFLYGHGPFVKDLDHYRDATMRGLAAWKEFTSLHDPAFLVPTALLVLALILIWTRLLTGMSTRLFRCSTLAIVVFGFISLTSFQFADKLPQQEIYALMDQSFIRSIPVEDRTLYRYYPVFIADGYQKVVPPTYRLTGDQSAAAVEMAFSVGWPNTNFHYRMPSIEGYDVFVPNAYINTLARVGSTFGAQDYTRSLPLDEKVGRLKAHVGVIGMMGAKYVVSGVQLQIPELTLLYQYSVSRLSIPMYVYKNTTALPIVYSPRSITETPAQSLEDLVTNNTTDFMHTTYVDCADCGGVVTPLTITSVTGGNGTFTAHVSSGKAGWLVYSETLLPGWSAAIDGKPTTILRANGLYMAVPVPTGSHTVEFVYHGQLNRGI